MARTRTLKTFYGEPCLQCGIVVYDGTSTAYAIRYGKPVCEPCLMEVTRHSYDNPRRRRTFIRHLRANLTAYVGMARYRMPTE